MIILKNENNYKIIKTMEEREEITVDKLHEIECLTKVDILEEEDLDILFFKNRREIGKKVEKKNLTKFDLEEEIIKLSKTTKIFEDNILRQLDDIKKECRKYQEEASEITKSSYMTLLSFLKSLKALI